MLDRLLGDRAHSFQGDVDFGFHSVSFRGAGERAASLEHRNAERGILRKKLRLVCQYHSISAIVRLSSRKRKFTMASPYPEGGPRPGSGGKTSLVSTRMWGSVVLLANFICCIGLVLAIIFLVTEKENRFVKFMRSVVFLVGTQIAVASLLAFSD